MSSAHDRIVRAPVDRHDRIFGEEVGIRRPRRDPKPSETGGERDE